MRSDLGYDAIVLAMKDHDDIFQVYLLGDATEEETWLFEEKNSQAIKPKVIRWCQKNLSDDMVMTSLPVTRGQLHYQKTKQYLHQNKVPYEMRQRTFYIRKREFDLYQDTIHRLVK